MATFERVFVPLATQNETLPGVIAVPYSGAPMVIFAHGSGSSHLSSRNRFVAERLVQQGLGVFLFDLLTSAEDEYYDNRFDIPLLTRRLRTATDWLVSQPDFMNVTFGYFGASTGSAAALRAAAEPEVKVRAVVSRGGRPDMALAALPLVTAPVLLIVGGLDTDVIRMNEAAFSRLPGVKDLKVVPGASHLFEEPGKLEEVAILSAGWFKRYLTGTAEESNPPAGSGKKNAVF